MQSQSLKIEMQNNIKYLPAVLNSIKEFGKIRGLIKNKQMNLELAAEESIVRAVDYCNGFTDDPIIISCSEIPRGVRLSVYDKGKPDIIDFSELDNKNLSEEELFKNVDTMIMKGISDKVEFRNLGMDGREIVMEFYLDDVSILDSEKDKPKVEKAVKKQHKWKMEDVKVFPMKDEDAIEVSRCVFDVYGYTYAKEDFYFPERLIRLQKCGEIFFAVAKLPDNSVAGTAAINRATVVPGLFEYQSLVVKKEFRGLGVAKKISDFLINHEKENSPEMEGFFTESVTNHPYTQKILIKDGFGITGFFFGMIPGYVNFKGIESKSNKRISTVFNVLRIKQWERLTLHVPEKHKKILELIYSQFNAVPEIITEIVIPDNIKNSVVDTIFIENMQLGIIIIKSIGTNFENLIKQRIFKLKSDGVEVISIYIDMNSIHTPWAVSLLEDYGFVFTGLLPGNETFHPMLLQWFGGVGFDVTAIDILYDIGKKLLEHIKKHDKTLSIA
jgi:anti-sigma regulatory factor (Ser/Thr protein kinase)/GNAT superfamily N-acetyltransferase